MEIPTCHLMNCTNVYSTTAAADHHKTFAYELAPVSASLLNDDGTMRKSTKGKLANYIIQQGLSRPSTDYVNAVIFDGCDLLHSITWLKVVPYILCVIHSLHLSAADVFTVTTVLTVMNPLQRTKKRKRRLIQYVPSPRAVVRDTPPIL